MVLALTSSPQPILNGKWLSPEAMVCAIGAATPDRRELDEEAMRGAVVVESREAAMKEAGDIVLAQAQVSAEIGELLNGAQLDRGDRPVVFKSVGIAVEDIAAAKLVYDKFVERGAIVFKHAIVRLPGNNFAQGLTTVQLGVPRFDQVLQQHARYCEALRECGLEHHDPGCGPRSSGLDVRGGHSCADFAQRHPDAARRAQPRRRSGCDAPRPAQLLS